MGGVDLFDQNMASYSLSWKSRRWWMKIFYYLVNAWVVNSYLSYKTSITNCKKMTHLQFRSQLANELMNTYSSRKRPGAPVICGKNKLKKLGGRTISVENVQRKANVGDHLPTKAKPRRCAYCSTKETVKRSKIVCRSCNVALCLECFVPFHEA